jgi:cytoskeletal protein CcmA (bactofilin family)
MWGKPEDPPYRTPSATPPAPAPPVANPPRNGSHSPTLLGKATRIVGEVSSEEDLIIDGELEGTLQLGKHLTLGPGSKVTADIKAREVDVFGTLRGNVEAKDRIAIHAGASIVGDIKTAGIVIDDGAYFKGGIDICRNEPTAPGVGEKR